MLFKTASIRSICEILNLFVFFSVSIFLNRHYGPSHYGTLVIFITLAKTASAFLPLGVFLTVERFVPLYSAQKKDHKVYTILFGGIGIYFISLIFHLSLIYFSQNLIMSFFKNKMDLSIYFTHFALYLVGTSALEFLFVTLRSLQLWKYEIILQLFNPICTLLLIIWFSVFLKLSILNVFFCYFITATLSLAITVPFIFASLRKKHPSINFSFWDPTAFKTFFTYGLPLMFPSLNIFLINWLDKIILSRYIPTSDLSFYYIATNLMNSMISIIKASYAIVSPKLASSLNFSEGFRKLKLLSDFNLIASTTCILISLILVKPLILFLYSETYTPAVTIFYILIISAIPRLVGYPVFLFTKNYLGNVFDINVVSLIRMTSISILFVLFIPKFFILGAVISIIFTNFLSTSVLFFILSKKKILPLQSLFKIDLQAILSFISQAKGGKANDTKQPL